MTGRVLLAASSLTCMLSGCGYTLVSMQEFRSHRLAADSVQIASLEHQLSVLQIQCRADSVLQAQYRADSVRYANLKATASANAVADSVLRAKDAEITSLQDQVAQLNEELDRIKRRLANPHP